MPSSFFKKDPTQDFTETLEPLENLDPIEDVPFAFERSSVHKPWGWYPFLYEGPFTRARFGSLVPFEGFGGFEFPTLPATGGGGGTPSGEIVESLHFTINDWLDEAAKALCDKDDPDPNMSEDALDFCETVMNNCDFSKLTGNLGQATSIEDAAQQDDGSSCGKTTCNAGLFMGDNPILTTWDLCDFTWEMSVHDLGNGCNTFQDEGINLGITLHRTPVGGGTRLLVCGASMVACPGTCAQRAIRVWTAQGCGFIPCLASVINTACAGACDITATCTGGVCELD